jgi:Putative DNA-binding domain
MFAKKLSESTKQDIEELVGTREGDELEFKQALATRDGKPDKWMIDQSEIGKQAKSDLTKEIVAFANASGGVVILGLGEDDENRALGLHPIPLCHVLADRLGQSIISSIDPKLEQFECVGVETANGEGVVVLRVGASGSAPHRDRDSREAYLRMGDKSEPMGMRQIQDMSKDRWQGRLEIERELEARTLEFERHVSFDQNFGLRAKDLTPLSCAGWRATAFPMERVFRKDIATTRAFQIPDAEIQFSSTAGLKVMHKSEYLNWRPMLRGVLCKKVDPNWPAWEDRIIQSNGLIEILASSAGTIHGSGSASEKWLHVIKPLASFAQILIMVEAFRSLTDRPKMAFALDFAWEVPRPMKLVMSNSEGFMEYIEPQREVNRLRDVSLDGETKLADLWIEIQREFFASFGQSVGNMFPIELDQAAKRIIDQVAAM